jgi:hypothetical protein
MGGRERRMVKQVGVHAAFMLPLSSPKLVTCPGVTHMQRWVSEYSPMDLLSSIPLREAGLVSPPSLQPGSRTAGVSINPRANSAIQWAESTFRERLGRGSSLVNRQHPTIPPPQCWGEPVHHSFAGCLVLGHLWPYAPASLDMSPPCLCWSCPGTGSHSGLSARVWDPCKVCMASGSVTLYQDSSAGISGKLCGLAPLQRSQGCRLQGHWPPPAESPAVVNLPAGGSAP